MVRTRLKQMKKPVKTGNESPDGSARRTKTRSSCQGRPPGRIYHRCRCIMDRLCCHRTRIQGQQREAGRRTDLSGSRGWFRNTWSRKTLELRWRSRSVPAGCRDPPQLPCIPFWPVSGSPHITRRSLAAWRLYSWAVECAFKRGRATITEKLW